MRKCLLAMAVSLAVVPAAAMADVFIDNTYEKLRTNADWGTATGGTGALGQLENITGQTVDRSSGSSSLPSRPATYSAPARSAAAAAKARSNAAAVDAMAAGLMVFTLLQAMDAQSDAAARAAAEAERQRQLEAERQRQLRLQAAARQRALWEQQDASEGGDLGGIFSNTGGTAFFGMPGVVDPSALGIGKSGSGASAPDQPLPFVPPPPLPPQVSLLEKGQEKVKETVTDLLKKAAEESMPSQLKNSKDALAYMERADEFVGELFTLLSPASLVKALVDPDAESAQRLVAALQRFQAKAGRVAFDQDDVSDDKISAAARLLSGGSLAREEVRALADEELSSSVVDGVWDFLTGGD